MTFTIQPAKPPPTPHSFALFARSFAREQGPFPILSTTSAFLQQNTGGGIKNVHSHFGRRPPFARSDSARATFDFQLPAPNFLGVDLQLAFNSFRIRTYRRTPRFTRFWPQELARKSFRFSTYGEASCNSFRIRTYEKTGEGLCGTAYSAPSREFCGMNPGCAPLEKLLPSVGHAPPYFRETP